MTVATTGSTTVVDILRPTRPIALPDLRAVTARRETPARPAARPTEGRRPVHLAVVVGISAGAYAASLAGVTALQAASDRQLSDANAPAREAIASIAGEHDRLDERLTAAGTAYGSAATAYADIVDRMTGVETRLGSLARQVKKVEGSAAWVPPAVRMPSVSRAAAARSKPASNGSTGASGH